MIIPMAILAIVSVGVPLYVSRKYEPPDPLTWPVALRYLLMCVIVFLCGLMAGRDPLLVDWRIWILGAAALFAAALVIVVWDSVGYGKADTA